MTIAVAWDRTNKITQSDASKSLLLTSNQRRVIYPTRLECLLIRMSILRIENNVRVAGVSVSTYLSRCQHFSVMPGRVFLD